MEFIKVPFGYLLDWLYQFSTNYGLALILFSLIVKVVLLPMNIKSKKSMLKMSRMAPLAKALEAQYGDDKMRYQQEVTKLYKEEGISPTGGCLWSFIPLLILLPLYYVIREPITYMLHASKDVVEVIKTAAGDVAKSNTHFWQLSAAQSLHEIPEAVAAGLQSINFDFFGINLAQTPVFKFWTLSGWSEWGLFLLPVLSGLSNILSMWVNQLMNNKVITNEKGEQDKDAAKNNQSMGMMMWIMPLISVWIGYSLPAAVTVYWIAQAIFGLVIDAIITVYCRKSYSAEDAARREKAILERLQEEERERIRAERRAANPDGITQNTSKKKMERKEREEQEAAKKRYELEKLGIDPDAEPEVKEVDLEDCPSGIPERPYCKGRAYDPNRYSKNNKE